MKYFISLWLTALTLALPGNSDTNQINFNCHLDQPFMLNEKLVENIILTFNKPENTNSNVEISIPVMPNVTYYGDLISTLIEEMTRLKGFYQLSIKSNDEKSFEIYLTARPDFYSASGWGKMVNLTEEITTTMECINTLAFN